MVDIYEGNFAVLSIMMSKQTIDTFQMSIKSDTFDLASSIMPIVAGSIVLLKYFLFGKVIN